LIKKPNFFVFTGGPGVGKTTLIRHLESLGERVVEESARAVIREQVASGGGAVPWLDLEGFGRKTVERDIGRFDELQGETARVFFDRGIMDSYGIAPAQLVAEALDVRRYNQRVFLFPPWREIYETDDERKQTWAEAVRTFDTIQACLPPLGYEPVIVPKGAVTVRAEFVLSLALQDRPSPP
jgi:predicted ATPase